MADEANNLPQSKNIYFLISARIQTKPLHLSRTQVLNTIKWYDKTLAPSKFLGSIGRTSSSSVTGVAGRFSLPSSSIIVLTGFGDEEDLKKRERDEKRKYHKSKNLPKSVVQ